MNILLLVATTTDIVASDKSSPSPSIVQSM